MNNYLDADEYDQDCGPVHDPFVTILLVVVFTIVAVIAWRLL